MFDNSKSTSSPIPLSDKTKHFNLITYIYKFRPNDTSPFPKASQYIMRILVLFPVLVLVFIQ